MKSKIENIIALRYLKPKRKEGFLKVISIFSFLGIALGVATLIIVMSVMNGFRVDLIEKILGFNPHLTVKPYEKKIDINDVSKLDSISDSISKFMLSYTGEAIFLNKDYTKGSIVRAYKQKDFKKLKIISDEIEGKIINEIEKGTVSIGRDLSISFNIDVGDSFNLMSTSKIQTPFGDVPKQESFIVSSIFNSGLAEFDNNVLFLNMDDAISLFDLSEKDILLEIFLKKPDDVQQVKKKVEKIFNEYYIYSWADLNKSFFGALKVERNVMFIILTLIIIVAAFNIISGLTILVKNKTKDIAILRTLGMSQFSIAKVFFLVGFIIGTLATITGVIIGVSFSLYIEEIRIILTNVFNIQLFPEEIYFLSKMPSEINIKFILIISFFSLLVTALATIFPSVSAAKLDPIKALKYE